MTDLTDLLSQYASVSGETRAETQTVLCFVIVTAKKTKNKPKLRSN